MSTHDQPAATAGSLSRIVSSFYPELRKEFRLFAAFTGGNGMALACTTVSGLLVARWAGPDNLGYLNTAALLLAYTPILLFGVNNGLNRELPFLVGSGRVDEAQALADTAWWWCRLVAVMTGAVFAAFAVVTWFSGNHLLRQALLAHVVIGSLWCLCHYMEVTYRTSNDFIRLSKIKALNSLAGVASVTIVYLSPWLGLLGRSVGLQGLYAWSLHRSRRILPKARFDFQVWRRLVKIGLPIFLVGYLASVAGALDRTLIVKLLSPRDMGLYTVAIQVYAALSVLPSSINQIVYPRMCETYGRMRSARSLAGLAFGPVVLLAVVLVPIYAFCWWFVGPFVRFVLPAYVEGIPAARWMVVAMYFMCLSTPQNVFPTLNRLWPYVVSILIGAAANATTTLLLLHRGWGLSAVATGNACGVAVLGVVSAGFAGYLLLRERGAVAGDP